ADESVAQIEAIRRGEDTLRIHKSIAVNPFLERIASIIRDLNNGIIQQQIAVTQVQEQAAALVEEIRTTGY
ncbi:MAG TPA: hypothetical protein VJL89_01015, partial [Thermodesulfovibrionia bacterium]|nr:hypothetical protein [Thermodesulfovibrionia bacterium]